MRTLCVFRARSAYTSHGMKVYELRERMACGSLRGVNLSSLTLKRAAGFLVFQLSTWSLAHCMRCQV